MEVANDNPSPFQVTKKHRSARNYFKHLQPHAQDRIRTAVRKICRDPFDDHRPLAIKPLKGRLSDLSEYRIIGFIRIIYRIADKQQRHLEIHEIRPHLP